MLKELFAKAKTNVSTHYGLSITPEKIQYTTRILCLGKLIKASVIALQRVELRKNTLKTLKDFQKLLEDLN